MNKTIVVLMVAAAGLFTLTGCSSSESSDVPSGTYKGKITKVEAEKNEIYVETSDGKELELYFTKDTKLNKGPVSVDWSETPFAELLKKGMEVQVEVENKDGKLIPKSVKIPTM